MGPKRKTARKPRSPRRVARRPPAAPTRAKAIRILDRLEATHPDATCALHFRNPWELLAATILSAQCTDERVNQVTPELFARFKTAADMAAAAPGELELLIRSTGFFRSKAKSLIGCARGLVERHAGEVPPDFAALVKLPGVGRKTASVVLGHTYGIAEGIAVDTHVLRVSNRIGLARGDEPAAVEEQLMKLVPRERWIRTTDLLIFHGRRVCDARRPACGRCSLFTSCAWESKTAWVTAG